MTRTLLFLTLFSTNVWATGPQVTGITGASATSIGDGNATPTALGGVAGDTNLCAHDTGFCNTCKANVGCGAHNPAPVPAPQSVTSSLCACNTNRITDETVLTIAAVPPTGATGGKLALVFSNNGTSGIAIEGSSLTTLALTWRDICTGGSIGGGTCENATAGNNQVAAQLFIDKNGNGIKDAEDTDVSPIIFRIIKVPATDWDEWNETQTEGIGSFKPFPGDEKLFIKYPNGGTNFPHVSYGGSQSLISKVRIYVTTDAMPDATYGGTNTLDHPVDLDLDSDGKLSNSFVDGLENGKVYGMRFGMVDEAGNVALFFPNGVDTAAATNCDVAPLTPEWLGGCPWAGKPDEVLGLLTKDFNCFIATAAYGSSLEPKLEVFRQFRNYLILYTSWGMSFVKTYYHYGPIGAHFIHDKPVLRAMVQGILWPLYGFSWLTLKIGLIKSTLLSMTLLSLLILLPTGFWRSRRRG